MELLFPHLFSKVFLPPSSKGVAIAVHVFCIILFDRSKGCMTTNLFNMKKLIGVLFLLLIYGMSTATVMAKARIILYVGGFINSKEYLDYDDNHGFHSDYEVGGGGLGSLNVEIPIRNLFIETGIGYVFTNMSTINSQSLRVPLKLGYQWKLNEKNSFLLSAGPYVGYELGDMTVGHHDFKNKTLSSGINASLIFRHRAFNVGLMMQTPCFVKATNKTYGDQRSESFLGVVLGVKFGKIHVNMDKLYQGLEIANAALSGFAEGYNSGMTNNSYGGASSFSDNSNSTYDDSKTASNKSTNYQSIYEMWERRAKSAYQSLDKQSMSPSNYTTRKKLLRNAQKEMRKTRQKARKDGVIIQESEWESKNVNLL